MRTIQVEIEVLDECRCGGFVRLFSQGNKVDDFYIVPERDLNELDAECPDCGNVGTLKIDVRMSQRMELKEPT
jgi:hypothetical protein